MNHALPLLSTLLLAPLSSLGEEPPWWQQAWDSSQATILSMGQQEQDVDKALSQLGVPVSGETASPLPSQAEEAPDHSSIITARGGMFFDIDTPRIVYLDQVELTDARLVLQARQRLSIQLPQQTRDQAQSSLETAARQQTFAPLQETPEYPKPTPQATPLRISADTVLVDAQNNRILLHGQDVSLSQEGHCLNLSAAPGQQSQILADSQGDIAIQTTSLLLRFRDQTGATATVTASGGRAYYRSATRELAIPGPCRLERDGDSLQCDDFLLISLVPSPQEESGKPGGFMPQFTAFNFNGISRAQAWGQVRLARQARDRQPAASVAGDELTYDAKSGQCLLQGDACSFSYGANCLNVQQGSLRLEPNGDIILQGTSISGVYERPGAQGMPALIGTLTAQQELRFRAETGVISTNHGLKAQDAAAQFSCTGPVELVLAPRPEAREATSGTGGLNLAVLNYGDVAHIRASGQVEMLAFNQQYPQICELSLSASELEGDLMQGELALTSAPGLPAKASFRGYAVEALSSQSLSSLHLAPNGDILAQGESIHTQANNGGSTFRARCKQRLEFKNHTVFIGPEAVLESDSGILTTQGPAQLVLQQAQAPPAESSRYPQFQYNYLGIREAKTEQGGTVRTAQGSMECRGPIHLTLDPTNIQGEFGGVKTATASDHVALAGKDNTGRLMKATGDHLSFDAISGIKRLTGRQVTVGDALNMHTASGRDASIIIDKDNRIRMTGERQSTIATGIRSQIEQQQQKKGNHEQRNTP